MTSFCGGIEPDGNQGAVGPDVVFVVTNAFLEITSIGTSRARMRVSKYADSSSQGKPGVAPSASGRFKQIPVI